MTVKARPLRADLNVRRCALVVLACVLILGNAAFSAASERRLITYSPQGLELTEIRDALTGLLSDEAKVTVLSGKLLIAASEQDHALARQLFATLGAPTQQYIVTIVQGASREQARKLIAGDNDPNTRYTYSTAERPRISSVQVAAGEAATVSTTNTRSRVSSAITGIRTTGVTLDDEVTKRGFSVVAVPVGRKIEVKITPLDTRESQFTHRERQQNAIATTVIVAPNQWISLSESADLASPQGATYSTRDKFDPTHTLLRVSSVN